MKISYNWLLDFLPEDYHRSPDELSEILTDTGLEVEGVERVDSIPGGLEGIVIGEVLTCKKHENADKLKCTTVKIGTEVVPIVCGAPNVEAGQKVVVATVGATIHPTEGDPFEIKKAKIRGEVSQGMICAEDELSLGQSHAGIMVLPSGAKVGQKAADYFNVTTDYQIEIGLTPNRTDAMSHFGVARDIVAALNHKEGKQLTIKPLSNLADLKEGNCPVTIEVENKERCPRYAGLVIENLKVAPSPEWLQNRLKTIGLKPINNLVDITNYVCHGFGHPMHAFDLEKVAGQKVIVKTAKAKDKFTTLDEVERTLHEEDLMICNAESAMCIAGVFGGLSSGVSETTKGIFLESAYFNPVSVRKTAKRQALNTDASFRYERGIDPTATLTALQFAAKLYTDIAGGEIKGGYQDVNAGVATSHQCEFSLKGLNTLAGVDFDKETVKAILKDLDITILSEKEDKWTLDIPAYRVDVTRHADVCEEVMRIYGFNAIPIPQKIALSPGKRERLSKHKAREIISAFLAAKGLAEGMSNGLTNANYKTFDAGIEKSAINLLNPLSSDLGILRNSMLFSSLDAVLYNQKFGNERIALFEFGKAYFKAGEGYNENEQLAITLSGLANEEGWNTNAGNASWSDLKSLVYSVIDRLGFKSALKTTEGKEFWMEYGMEISFRKKSLVKWGKVKAELLKKSDIKKEVFFAVFDFDFAYEALANVKPQIAELPKFPGMRRDLSLLLEKEVEYQALEKVSKKAANQLLQSVSLFDVYEGKNLEKGKKSYALSYQFRSPEKTLTDKEVDAQMDKIMKSLEKELGASLR
ncbi:phenylalanine--tRNA ligase subunit beta [Luteibaculum oceani]|uniref:Phenylalanine--tRNA ligase beta subunit n=1 Tax=Luteibaculum oceani TaxID=1294296 RepID=A0A5C6V3V8_9FLAO|nr:phenylalanine--tRNA ligase subunit beta [Luteibaculum oceani]TXC78338.1 phenylalanine--tRNA ligase subunit beta [Luteibaculum oceani]